MLNIISRSIVSKYTRGPKKVVENLIKGLDKIGYPYAVNQMPESCEHLWIHDDPDALIYVSKHKTKTQIMAGPNIYVLPRDIPTQVDLSNIVSIVPSLWVRDLWKEGGYNNTIDIWAVGVNTDEFTPKNSPKDSILVYVKDRKENDLSIVIDHLVSKNIKHKIIRYGSYTEDEYKDALDSTKGIVWLGRSESQGIALLEALSMNVPALVCDVENFGDNGGADNERFTTEELSFADATSAHYFDYECGIILQDVQLFPLAIDEFLLKLRQFTSRTYILNNFTLEQKAREFIALYEKHFGTEKETTPKLQGFKPWKNARTPFILTTRVKDFLRKMR